MLPATSKKNHRTETQIKSQIPLLSPLLGLYFHPRLIKIYTIFLSTFFFAKISKSVESFTTHFHEGIHICLGLNASLLLSSGDFLDQFCMNKIISIVSHISGSDSLIDQKRSAPLSHRNQKSQYKINPDFFAIFGASTKVLK
jgi:hypothetical protein